LISAKAKKSKAGEPANNLLLICIDADGKEIWKKNVDIDLTSFKLNIYENDKILIGSNNGSGLLLTKIDIQGKIHFSKFLSDEWTDKTKFINVSNDSTITIIGNTGEDKRRSFFIIADKKGDQMLRKDIDFGNYSDFSIYSVETIFEEENAGGGFVLGGESSNSPFVIMLDNEGNLVWKKEIEIIKGDYSGPVTSIKKCKDRGYIFTGYSSDSGSKRGFFIKGEVAINNGN
jgi:hypothetical protein